jgi:hypothetical protein
MKAKYYIYWNIHLKCFSVRYRGKVIGHHTAILAKNATFSVSKKGRERVLREQSKNVHAFVVAEEILTGFDAFSSYEEQVDPVEAKYNPYKYSTFVDSDGNKITKAGAVYMAADLGKPQLLVFGAQER